MSSTVLLAGATGALGLQIIGELLARGHRVVALCRPGGAARLARFSGRIEVREADPLRREALAGVLSGCQVLLSCLGASVLPTLSGGRAGYTAVDTPANVHLVDEAKAAGVEKIIYVSVAGAADHGDLAYYRAHEDVVRHIQRSGVPATILRPTGFFSALSAYVDLARRGRVPLIADGSARSNPIADQDLARLCAEAISDPRPEREVGGPEVLTRRQMVELAFAALGRAPRVVPVPPLLFRLMALLLLPFLPRLSQLLSFVVRVSTTNVIVEAAGTLRLEDHFNQVVGCTSAMADARES